MSDVIDPTLRVDLEDVFRREYAFVVAAARRVLGSEHAAEDVAQEVFLAFARSGVAASQSRGWLAVAAVHTALNQVRGERRRVDREERTATDLAHPSGEQFADDITQSQERRWVREALARLPRQQATVLVLRHSGLSYTEVATHMNLSPTSVGTTLRRAEAALRKELSDDSSQ